MIIKRYIGFGLVFLVAAMIIVYQIVCNLPKYTTKSTEDTVLVSITDDRSASIPPHNSKFMYPSSRENIPSGSDRKNERKQEKTYTNTKSKLISRPVYHTTTLSNGVELHRSIGKYYLETHPYSDSESSSQKSYFSQYNQEDIILKLFNNRGIIGNRFFIEVGGYDGQTFSNTLYFEKILGWDGLLIETNPYAYEKLLSRSRKVYSTQTCLDSGHGGSLDFQLAGDMTVSTEHNSEYHRKKMDAQIKNIQSRKKPKTKTTPDKDRDKYRTMNRNDGTGEILRVQCTSLLTILKGIPDMSNPFTIDLFVIDVEGAELDILRALAKDWNTFDVRLFMIEVLENRDEVRSFMRDRGYTLVHTGQIDEFFMKIT
jgi:hypothetical protein